MRFLCRNAGELSHRLKVSLLAINKGLTEVVSGSLTGSVVGNILLVLGFSLFFGRGDPNVDRDSSFIWLGLILVVSALLTVAQQREGQWRPQRGAS